MPKIAWRLLRSLIPAMIVGMFPLVALWKNNLGQVSPSAVYHDLLYTFLYTLVAFAVWLLITRSPEKTVWLSAASAVFVFSFGHLYNLVSGKTYLGFSMGFVKLFLACAVLFAAACFWIIRAKRVPDPLLLSAPAGLLLLFNLVPIARASIHIPSSPSQPVVSAAGQTGAQNRPDIYYIILDAYARSDILKDVIGYDNTPFITALQDRGFYIPECAYSNYAGTAATVLSVLNMDHLSANQTPDFSRIQDNKASEIFRSYGYQFVTGRGYASFNDITTSDVYLNYAIDQGIEDNLAEQRFTSMYLNTTVFRVLAELYKNNPEKYRQMPFWLAISQESDPSLTEANFWYYQNNYMFDSLEKIPEKPGDYFVYAHINAPHGPYVYRSDGSFRYPLDDQDEKVRYADAITYINKRVLEVVDTLQKKSNPAPVIIIQGDHGIHNMTTGLNKHKILSAYYLPGSLNTPPYKTITPVNNFRLVLRNYFDPSVPLLPDTLWVKFLNDEVPTPSSCDLKP